MEYQREWADRRCDRGGRGRAWADRVGYVAIIGEDKARGLTLFGDVRPEAAGRMICDIASRMDDDRVFALMHQILALPMVDLFSRPPKTVLKRAKAEGVSGLSNSGNWFEALGNIVNDPLALSRFGYWPGDEWIVGEPLPKITPLCSLTCEHAYVFDLARETLDYYQGAQFDPHTEGMFVETDDWGSEMREIYPVRLHGGFPFAECDSETWRDIEVLRWSRPWLKADRTALPTEPDSR